MLADVALVIIGRNEGERLRACFQSLSAFDRQSVVYVDSGSADESVRLAKEYGFHVVELDMSTPFTAARARNAGFDEVKRVLPGALFVQFLDGDCALVASWIATARKFLIENEDVAVVCGRRREKFRDMSVYNMLADMEWNTRIGEANSCGGDFLIRCDAFERVSGFDGFVMAGEEVDLCDRLRTCNWRIWRIDSDMSVHDANMHSFSEWWRRGNRAGYAILQVTWLRRNSKRLFFGRDILRALFWAVVLPFAIFSISLVSLYCLFLLPAAYLFQVARVWRHEARRGSEAWLYAAFVVLDNFARIPGLFRFCIEKILGTKQKLIEYKNGGTG